MSGLPIAVTRAAAPALLTRLRPHSTGAAGAAAGRGGDWREDASEVGAVWARRGDLFAVHAAGNTPGVHGLWPEALALGYKVAVRPSPREPFTAFRLVSALREAGFPRDALYLPTDYAAADVIVPAAELRDRVRRPGRRRQVRHDPAVLTKGPGRSKILITAELDWRDNVDVIVESVSHLGGIACVAPPLYWSKATRAAGPGARRAAASSQLPTTDEPAILTIQPTTERVAVDATSRQGRGDPPGARRRHGRRRARRRSRSFARRCTWWPSPRAQAQRRTAVPVRVGRPVGPATASRRCGTRWCSPR